MIFIYLAVSFGCSALLAYKWKYTTTYYNEAARRNKQWVLVVALLSAAVSCFIAGLSRLL